MDFTLKMKNKNIKIEKAAGTGFCFGVRRAITALEEVAKKQGGIETLGAVVHNQQVLQRLAELGVSVAGTIDDVKGDTIAIGAHGVGPEVGREIGRRNLKIVDTTCRFVHRAQSVAQRLSKSGFFVVVYGDVNHPEVKGIIARTGAMEAQGSAYYCHCRRYEPFGFFQILHVFDGRSKPSCGIVRRRYGLFSYMEYSFTFGNFILYIRGAKLYN